LSDYIKNRRAISDTHRVLTIFFKKYFYFLYEIKMKYKKSIEYFLERGKITQDDITDFRKEEVKYELELRLNQCYDMYPNKTKFLQLANKVYDDRLAEE